ncbi:hypothetical protein RchiOBHm_Chr2g0130081 [Rosa chinensis]|uniref:COBRA-like protein n=1 Tax=Rosa chinensis TaxID=74649 RepID=A0A2P6RUR5_ROSCH|nr:COBRA-like protein 1 [Rosa chinensis]XP_040370303.1 COBRA-like protein 1 [Rosa chinensis]PRQ50163.1 hypothetical protein RchiOBHm_Chr2g0130081 [Rosa chinensis]
MMKPSAFYIAVFCFLLPALSIEAYDPLDPTGNITIRWDILSWTEDGYVAIVTIRNYQMYRHIEAPGWRLGWSWARGEVLWSMLGAETTERGDCSRFGGGVDGPPHCCDSSPKVVDLLPGVPYNQRISQCCRGGNLGSMVQDQAASASMFQMTVAAAGTTKKTVRRPKNFTLEAPGPGYTCGPARIVDPTRYPSPDRRRHTQALVSWNVVCTYSQFLASATPTCCVSLSSFYSKMLVSCRTCACGCKSNPGGCAGPNSPDLSPAPRVQCTSHMCPVRVHWHVKLNYKEYWRVKISVTNFNYKMNYTQWNLVVQHPNFNNMTTSYSFNSHSLGPYGDINDTTMFWGLEYFNDMLLEAGLEGNVRSDILFGKSKSSFTFANGWAFPRRIYFNGEECVMPPVDVYPRLPSSSRKPTSCVLDAAVTCILTLLCLAMSVWQ